MSEYYKQNFVKEIMLIDAEYEECTFENITIMEKDIKNCIFTNCTFNNCELSNIHILNSKIMDSIFNKCKLIGIEWNKFDFKFGFGNHFVKCFMPYSVFVNMDLAHCMFENCDLKESYFEEVDAKEVSFKESNLEKVQFLKCDLKKCDFTGAKSYYFDIRNNNCKDAKFDKEDAVYLLNAFGVKLN